MDEIVISVVCGVIALTLLFAVCYCAPRMFLKKDEDDDEVGATQVYGTFDDPEKNKRASLFKFSKTSTWKSDVDDQPLRRQSTRKSLVDTLFGRSKSRELRMDLPTLEVTRSVPEDDDTPGAHRTAPDPSYTRSISGVSSSRGLGSSQGSGAALSISGVNSSRGSAAALSANHLVVEDAPRPKGRKERKRRRGGKKNHGAAEHGDGDPNRKKSVRLAHSDAAPWDGYN